MENPFADKSQIELDIEQADIDKKALDANREQLDQAEEAQVAAEQEVSKKEPGVGEEIKNAVVGGLAEAGSDVVTLPERLYDMANGEMEEAGEDYKPEFDPFAADQFETKTWWGTLLKGAIQYGTLALPVGTVAKGLGMGTKFLTGATIAGRVGQSVAVGTVLLLSSRFPRGQHARHHA